MRGRRFLVACIAVLGGLLWLGPAGQAAPAPDGAVYVQTNTAPTNHVLVFNRSQNGTLTLAGRFATGGAGKPAENPPLGIPYIDTAGSVTLSDNGRFLFVVNAGDNTVSSFRVGPKGLQLADREQTFGSRPASSTSHGSLLYVLNSDTGSASISGYRVDNNGALTPIRGSVKPTSSPANGIPAQIEFNAQGTLLAVTERQTFVGNGLITTYAVRKDGTTGPPVPHASSGKGPFGIAFTHDDLMIISNEHFPEVTESSVSSYDVSKEGDITPIDTAPANAGGACWNVLTNDEKFVFITSPFTANVNSFRLGKHGDLIPVNGTSVVATAGGATLDVALSRNSRYLYVLVTPDFGQPRSVINAYLVNKDGTIRQIGTTGPFEGSASGAAAW